MSGSLTFAYEPFPDVEGRNVVQRRIEVPLLVRLLDLPPGARILETGCGRGVALPVLARLCRPRRLVGVDVDVDALTVAASRVAGAAVPVEIVRADVRCLPFPSGVFDLVIDFGTCYHVDDRERAVSEISRVLDLGGRFVCETRASQALAHPIRSSGRGLPWRAAPRLERTRTAVLWSCQVKR